jgi:hypothetical protein
VPLPRSNTPGLSVVPVTAQPHDRCQASAVTGYVSSAYRTGARYRSQLHIRAIRDQVRSVAEFGSMRSSAPPPAARRWVSLSFSRLPARADPACCARPGGRARAGPARRARWLTDASAGAGDADPRDAPLSRSVAGQFLRRSPTPPRQQWRPSGTKPFAQRPSARHPTAPSRHAHWSA